jgi:hypothetical protein
MLLTACGCRAEHYQRSHRNWWMRMVPTRRLYHCYACSNYLLIPPVAKDADDIKSLHSRNQRLSSA